MYVGKILCFESSTYTWLIETCKNECLNVIFLKQCLLPKFVSIHSVFVVTVRGRIKEKFVLSQILKKKSAEDRKSVVRRQNSATFLNIAKSNLIQNLFHPFTSDEENV